LNTKWWEEQKGRARKKNAKKIGQENIPMPTLVHDQYPVQVRGMGISNRKGARAIVTKQESPLNGEAKQSRTYPSPSPLKKLTRSMSTTLSSTSTHKSNLNHQMKPKSDFKPYETNSTTGRPIDSTKHSSYSTRSIMDSASLAIFLEFKLLRVHTNSNIAGEDGVVCNCVRFRSYDAHTLAEQPASHGRETAFFHVHQHMICPLPVGRRSITLYKHTHPDVAADLITTRCPSHAHSGREQGR
jgi:hypothetical protein